MELFKDHERESMNFLYDVVLKIGGIDFNSKNNKNGGYLIIRYLVCPVLVYNYIVQSHHNLVASF